jgi:hypothetical protein
MSNSVDATAVTDSVLARTQSLRIFFGHQSVGGNVIAGVQALADSGISLPLQVIRTIDPDSVAGAVLGHEWIGENGDPAGKMAAFLKILRGPGTTTVNTAMMKLCYSDFTKNTDPQALFASYVAMVDSLRAARPDLVLAHVTTPLVAPDGTLKYLLRTVRGRLTNAARNTRIQEYNALMRSKYGPGGQLFDLAAFEAGGSMERGAALRAAFTDDGEHLNASGQRVVSSAYLSFLGSVARP